MDPGVEIFGFEGDERRKSLVKVVILTFASKKNFLSLRYKKFGSGTPDPETGFAFARLHQEADGPAGCVDWQRRGDRTERKCGWYQDAPPVNFVLFVDLP